MSDHTVNHIPLQAFDLYRRIEQIHRQPTAAPENIRAKYILLYKVLEQACYELTADVTLAFANLFSRLDYICKKKGMTPSDKYSVQTLRRNCNAALRDSFNPVMEEYLYDLRALVRFISLAFAEDVPAAFLEEIPHSNRPYQGTRHSRIPYLRVSVSSWDEEQIFAATDSDDEPFICISYARGGKQGDLAYLKELLKENLQLNLLDVKIDENNLYIPNLIVVHPDFLIDISALAACFREYGKHPLNYFINKIRPKSNTAPILLGNLASRFLDDYINEEPEHPVDYRHTLQQFFRSSALEFCTCTLPADFHQQAQAQMMHIRSFIRDILPQNVPDFDTGKTLLEASFLCERLGLQGRVDMLQKDFKILIEQKAGKRDEYHHRHKEDHFVQMMLYQGVLLYNFGHQAQEMQTFLLYSKYADGLVLEHFAETLFRDSIRLRNYIVTNEMALGEGAIASVTECLSTDLLNELQVKGRLWTDYQEPQLQEIIQTLKHCTPLERAYFQRFFTFVSKELILSKTGGGSDADGGFAGLWHTPLQEKIEAGNILTELKITDKQQSAPGKGYDLITLERTALPDDFIPNFRNGDIVIFYPYAHEPDVRHEILMKGNLLEINEKTVKIILRNGQQNKDIIENPSCFFAIEHDASDISAANGIRGLYAFLSARPERKSLLLGVRPPQADKSRSLNGSYGRFNEPVLKAKQAVDYFLLVGPPGTGKTSCALRFMVEEALTDAQSSILLLAYTNRAVDEICNMLIESGIAADTPFIRIGNEYACDERYRPYLLKHSISQESKLADIREKFAQTRIFVGTTAAINARLHLFEIKHFELAIIDEASQLLEPDLLGILAARHKQTNAIGKFILIGDYKQLPAITLQQEAEAQTSSRILQQIGLSDCRNSLFERLHKLCGDDFRCVLRQQGRMHPAIAEWTNHCFYFHENLKPVPLPHQEEECPYPDAPPPADNLDRLITRQRIVFIATTPSPNTAGSEKTNRDEARIATLLLERIYRYSRNSFDPHKTVGIIVPYRNQIAMLRREISGLGIPALNAISIDTVERYQGSQRDVIIYSFTIHNVGQLNFLTANTFREGDFIIDRKLNVALTRARKQLFLIGNPELLAANITFYKLMEYIRLHNGYIDTTADKFCRMEIDLPAYTYGWDKHSECYPLSEKFRAAFEALIPPPDFGNETLTREMVQYGRFDFGQEAETYRLTPNRQEGLPQSSIGQAERLHLYNFYYMRRSYCAARSLYELYGSALLQALRNTSGRTVFCDLSQESGASGLAFAEVCSRLPHQDMIYLGIPPGAAMEEITQRFFGKEPYRNIPYCFYPSLEAVPTTFWTAHAVLPEVIIFNLSNFFDRIMPERARKLAMHINRLVHDFPFNHYILMFRDDGFPRSNTHSYHTFCMNLHQSLRPLHRQMPFSGAFQYLDSALTAPRSESFLYEIRSNK